MGDNDSKTVSVDIPENAVQEALESIEKHQKARQDRAEAPSGEQEVELEIASDDGEPSREELLATCQELKNKLKETRDRMLRIAAEADNARKRALKERKEFEKFGMEKLFRDILPVLDNLERTLEHIPAEADDPVVVSLHEGLQMILRQFQDTLAKYHLTGFSATGEKFDPTLHEALNRVPSDQVEPGTVVSEMQRGYKLHDRLLRPAMVSVACRPKDLQTTETQSEQEPASSAPNGKE